MPQIRWERIHEPPYKWRAINSWTYKSERYNRSVTVEQGYRSDGATNARDIYSDAWGIHDVLCSRGTWDDGTRVTNLQASFVLSDILAGEAKELLKEGRKWDATKMAWRSVYWFWATFLRGGGKARENGMVRLRTTL